MLKLAENLKLPEDAVTQTFAVLAKRGVGKSYTAAVLAEEMLAAQQAVVIIDPTGAHWGLRSSADGKEAGFPIVVLGGDHADLPLEEHAGEVVAQSIVEHRFPAIIDLSHFRKGQASRFMAAFLESLYRLNREALHLIVDEADTFAPQRVMGEEARVCGAMEDVVKKGRIRGLGCTVITQRPAVLNKNVLTQCESLFVLRMTHPKDIDAIREWVGVHADEDDLEKIEEDLPSLPIGDAWFWSPGWLDMCKRITVRKRQTFDSGATPKAGQTRKAPKRLAEIDLAALGQKMQASVEAAKANDPKELKRLLAEARKQLTAKPSVQSDPAAIDRAVEAAVTKRDREWQASLKERETIIESLKGRMGKAAAILSVNGEAVATKPIPVPEKMVHQSPRPLIVPKTSVQKSGDQSIGGGLRRMMIALAQRPGLSARQIGVRAGLSSSSGTFGTYLARGRSEGWIVGDKGRLELTDAGASTLGAYDQLPEGQELAAYWLGQLGDSGAARILRTLIDAYPEALSKDELSERAELSANSGTFGTYLSKLRTLELVEGRGELKASAELF